jgi:hypothetical protein
MPHNQPDKLSLKSKWDDCPHQIWKCARVVRQLEIYVIPAYCAFLRNAHLPFQYTIKELGWDNIAASELYPLIEKLSNKMNHRKEWGRNGYVVKT